MYSTQRKLLSQNFLHDQKLVSKLLGFSSIGKNDLVLEIGPGKGIITKQLLKKAGKVISIEIDTYWFEYLKNKFSNASNLSLYKCDFLNFQLSKKPYKVFANIPFAIEGQIVRKLLDNKFSPEDCYLVLDKKLAIRLLAKNRENLFSVTYKPFYNFSIIYSFRRTDFSPVPNVDAVLFRFYKKTQTLISSNAKHEYQKFIKLGFGNGLSVYKNLQIKYGNLKVSNAFQKLSLSRKIKPGDLKLEDWVKLFTLI